MKNLKNILSILSVCFIMLLSFNTNAQSYEVVKDSRISGSSIEVPKELKADVNSKTKNKLTTIRDFSKKYGGYVYVSAYVDEKGNVKIASINVPSKTYRQISIESGGGSGGCPGGYRLCARGCNDKPTELGVALCIAYCIIDCHFGDGVGTGGPNENEITNGF